jgi:sulfur-oxidizing protein SoxX
MGRFFHPSEMPRGGIGKWAGLTLLFLAAGAPAQAQQVVPYTITEDAITAPLAGLTGNAERGRKLALDPERGNCTICHPVTGGDPRAQGNVGPPLAGVAGRLSKAQIRLRIVDGTRINPDTIMPPYHRVEGLNRVGREWIGKPVLSAQEVEDIVAFMSTLE